MNKVFKYGVPLFDNFHLDLPKGSKVLAFMNQEGSPMVWALVDPDMPTVTREFRLAGTGHPIDFSADFLQYVGSCQIGPIVLHLFEKAAGAPE